MSALALAFVALPDAQKSQVVTLQRQWIDLAVAMGAEAPPADARISVESTASAVDDAIAAYGQWAARVDAIPLMTLLGDGPVQSIIPGWPAIARRLQDRYPVAAELAGEIGEAYAEIATDVALSRLVDDRPAQWWLYDRATRVSNLPTQPASGLPDWAIALGVIGLAWAVSRGGRRG